MFDELDAVMRRMRSAASAGDRSAVVQANVDFHVGVVAASGHRRLVHVYRTLMVRDAAVDGNQRPDRGTVVR